MTGPMLESNWDQVGKNWEQLRPCWEQLGSSWHQSRIILGVIGSMLQATGMTLGVNVPMLGSYWDHISSV